MDAEETPYEPPEVTDDHTPKSCAFALDLPARFERQKSENNLKQLSMHLTQYAYDENHCPNMYGPRTNGGARDLYPLYLRMRNEYRKEFLCLLRPPGVDLVPFSTNPSPNEFDSTHIGYIYNSTIEHHASVAVPLMAERCVEDGMFSDDEKPVFKNGAHVPMSNGTVLWLPAKKGKLILGEVKVEDLQNLR